MPDSSEPDGLKRWRFPFLVSPSEWRVTPFAQYLTDGVASLLLLMVILTFAGGIIVWGAIVYHVIVSAFSVGADEAIRNLLLGLAGLLGAPFVVWRTLIAAQQTQINRESHYTDLFTKAVEQLAADKTVKKREFKPKYQVDEKGEFRRDKDNNPVPAVRPDGTPLGDWQAFEVTEINREVRLGAIYALERIAQDSERDHWPIMETLTSYVRNNSDTPLTCH